MQISILFVLLACLAFGMISASKERTPQPRNRQPPKENAGQAKETSKRVKRGPYPYPYIPPTVDYSRPYYYV